MRASLQLVYLALQLLNVYIVCLCAGLQVDRMFLTSHEFWLPVGIKWCRIKRGDDLYLQLVPWLALVMLLLRPLVEGWLAYPLGIVCEVAERSVAPPQHHTVLEKSFQQCKNPGEEQVVKLAREIGWSSYQVHKWFWSARNCRKPSVMTKFKESCWKFLMYGISSTYGIGVLLKESFTWDLSIFYENYPDTVPSEPLLVYWACQLAFYCSLLVTHFSNVKRKDFTQLLVHHIATVVLLLFCYIISMVQLGMLILIIHDISDIPLELAKMLHYAKLERYAEVVFTIFTVLFFITRLVIFPFWLLWAVAFDLPRHTGHFPAQHVALALLTVLQVLHIYWFKLIVLMVCQLLKGQGVKKDARSDSNISSDDTIQSVPHKRKRK